MIYEYKTYEVKNDFDHFVNEKKLLFYELIKVDKNKLTFKRDITIDNYEEVLKIENEINELNNLKERLSNKNNILKAPYKIALSLIFILLVFFTFLLVVSVISNDWLMIYIYTPICLSIFSLFIFLIIKNKKIKINNKDEFFNDQFEKLYQELKQLKN